MSAVDTVSLHGLTTWTVVWSVRTTQQTQCRSLSDDGRVSDGVTPYLRARDRVLHPEAAAQDQVKGDTAER